MELLKLGMRFACLSNEVAVSVMSRNDHVTTLDTNGKKIASFEKILLAKVIKVSTA